MVTLEDCLEELVGEIVDEYDVEPNEVVRLADGDYLVDGGMSIGDLNELLDIERARRGLGHGRRLRVRHARPRARHRVSGRVRRVALQPPSRSTAPHPAGAHRRAAGPGPPGHRRARPCGAARRHRAFVTQPAPAAPIERSGFVTLAGRPNVGKSTLLNASWARRSASSPTSRRRLAFAIRGVLNRNDVQIVFVDTPGIHKPVTELGKSVNRDRDRLARRRRRRLPGHRRHRSVRPRRPLGGREAARRTSWSSSTRSTSRRPGRSEPQLTAAAALEASAYFAVSARTGDGVTELLDHLAARMPDGPPVLPARDGDRPPRRDVGGRARAGAAARRHEGRAAVLDRDPGDRVGGQPDPSARSSSSARARRGWSSASRARCSSRWASRARAQLPPGTYLELFVRVDKNWQQTASRVQRLGY